MPPLSPEQMEVIIAVATLAGVVAGLLAPTWLLALLYGIPAFFTVAFVGVALVIDMPVQFAGMVLATALWISLGYGIKRLIVAIRRKLRGS